MKPRNLIALAITLIFLFLAIYKIDFSDFISAFEGLNPIWALPALFFYFLSFLFRAVRWRYMLADGKHIHLSSLFGYIVIGFMANNLLPARLGEFVRAYVTGRREQQSRSAVFASVVLERLFDGITIVIILLLLLYIEGSLGRPWLHYLSLVSSVVFAGGIVFLVMLTFMRETAVKFSAAIFSLLPARLETLGNHILGRFLSGLSLLRNLKDLLAVTVFSFAVWGCETLVYLTYLKAFDINVPLDAALLTLVVVNLSMMIPSSPGGIGIFQFACVKALAIFGVSQGTALAFSGALHATQLLPIIILGLILLPRMGFSFSEISHVELEDDPENPA